MKNQFGYGSHSKTALAAIVKRYAPPKTVKPISKKK